MLGVPISELTPYGVLLLFVLMVGFGLLIPRWMHNQRIADYKEQIALLQESLRKRDQQFDKALDNNALVVKALEGIRQEAAKS